MKNKSSCILCLVAAVMLLSAGGVCAFVLSGGEYDIESSVVDNGGGQQLSGGGYSSRGAIAQTAMPDNTGVTAGGEFTNRIGFYNPPHFVFQGGLPASLSLPDGASLTLPSFSVEKMRFDVTINIDPVSQPLIVDPTRINDASSKLIDEKGLWSQIFSGNLSEMAIFDEQDFYSRPLARRGILTMAYKDANDDGILDGSNPPVRVETLNAWMLDESVNSWVRLPDAGVNPSDKTLSVYFGMPGVYAIIGGVDQVVKDVYAYPVPFRPYGPNAGLAEGQTGTEGGGIVFANVPQEGNIEIYTPDGRLVKKLSIPENIDPILSKVKWDVRTASGDRAASGVYIWRVVAGSSSKIGKLMVIW